MASVAGTTRFTAGSGKAGAAAKEAQEDGGYWNCGCGCESNCAPRSNCRSCGVTRGRHQQQGQSSRKPQSTQSSFATVVAEEAAKLHAQLGQDAVDVPMMENGPDDVPSEEAEREHLRTLLANLDASIAARGCGGGRGRVPDSTDQAREVQAGPGSALGRQTAQDEAQSGPRGLRRQTRSTRRWSRRLLAKQKLTQQAKEARDAKAKELEEVEAEARTAREGSAQSARNSSSRSPSPMSPAQLAAGLQNALDGEVKESFNQWLEQLCVQAHQSLLQQQPVQMQAELLLHHSPSRSPQSGTTVPVEEAVRSVETLSRAQTKTTLGDFFGQSRFQPYRTRARPGNADGRSMASEVGPHGFS